jgi:hypothetical protein
MFIKNIKNLFVFMISLNISISLVCMDRSEFSCTDLRAEMLDEASFNYTIESSSSSSESSQSPAKKSKFKKEQISVREINDRICGKINRLVNQTIDTPARQIDVRNFRTVDAKVINELNPESFQEFHRQFNLLQESEDNGQIKLTENLAVKCVHDIVGQDCSDIDDRNNKLLSSYEKGSNLVSLIGATKVNLPADIVKYVAAIDLEHPMTLKRKLDKDDKLINIAGGHVARCYRTNNDCLYVSKGIASLDDNVIGITIKEANIQKTVYVDADRRTFLLNLDKSQLVAKQSSGMNIYQVSPGNFIGSYQSNKNRFLFETQFPVFAISDDMLQEDNGNILFANLVNFRSDGHIDHPTKEPLFVSKSQYEAIMSDSTIKPFGNNNNEYIVNEYIVKDITEPLEVYCSEALQNFGMQKLPCKFYGIKKIK